MEDRPALANYQIQQNTATYPLVFLLVQSADHISPATGLTPTVTISKAGGSFAAPAGAVSEIANGWYKVAGNATDANTLGAIILHATAAGADPTDMLYEVVAVNPRSANSYITGVNALAPPTRWNAQLIDANGNVALAGAPKKNTALAGFQFFLSNTVDHSPATGKTVTALRSIDGGAFAACTNSAAEIANGWYKIDLSASDMNGNVIALQFSATGVDSAIFNLLTTP